MPAKTVILGTKVKIFCLVTTVILCSSFSSLQADTMVRFDTVAGSFHVQLTDSVTPQTVNNFLNYVHDDDYANTFFHRLATGFVLQGGGFTFDGQYLDFVPTDNPVQNEFNASNTYGTIAMAKLGGDPNSATSQFFFNLGDNTGLDYDPENPDDPIRNGGFTVFGSVMGSGMDVVNLLASQNIYNVENLVPEQFSLALREVPLFEYDGTTPWWETFEMISNISVAILGDANGDGLVGADDYAAVQANFGASGDVGILGDANFDGVVSAADYASVQANFGASNAPAMTPTPEPTTMGLLAVGGLALLRRRKRAAGK